MNKLFYTLSILLGILAASCGKDNDDAPSRQIKLKSITSGNSSYSYTYGPDGKILAETHAESGNPVTTTSFTGFDAEGRLTDVTIDYTTGRDMKLKQTYTGEKKSRIEYSYADDGSLVFYMTIEYPANNIAIVKNYSGAGVFRYRNEYFFSNKGNMEEEKYYNTSGVNEFIYSYTNYDSKNTISNLLPAGYGTIEFRKNNFQNYQQLNVGTNAATVISYTYEYNAEGYPVKRTSNTGNVTTYEFSYQ